MASRRAGAVIVGDDSMLNTQTGAVASLALRYKLPLVVPTLRGVEDGALFAYLNDPRQRYRSAAGYVDRILKGAKAGELPIEQPTRFDMVINQKTAAALGITLPKSIVARANRIIE